MKETDSDHNTMRNWVEQCRHCDEDALENGSPSVNQKCLLCERYAPRGRISLNDSKMFLNNVG